jgi:hypothetical protein
MRGSVFFFAKAGLPEQVRQWRCGEQRFHRQVLML